MGDTEIVDHYWQKGIVLGREGRRARAREALGMGDVRDRDRDRDKVDERERDKGARETRVPVSNHWKHNGILKKDFGRGVGCKSRQPQSPSMCVSVSVKVCLNKKSINCRILSSRPLPKSREHPSIREIFF